MQIDLLRIAFCNIGLGVTPRLAARTESGGGSRLAIRRGAN